MKLSVGLENIIFYYLISMINSISIMISVLLAVALLTLLERKVLGYMQFRKGPNLVGPLGLLQPVADGLKLFMKENNKPTSATTLLFFIAPMWLFFFAFILWAIMPMISSGMKINLSLLLLIAISSLSAYAVLIAGWSSNSKYSLLGAVRGMAQTISYEVSFGMILLSMVLMAGGWSLVVFNLLQSGMVFLVVPAFPLFMMWFISSLAETSRAPFDLTEGESELVSGYNVEYSGAPFALFFLAEYAKIILMKSLSVVLFFGLSSVSSIMFNMMVFLGEVSFLVFSFLWVRASFPRMRYDQLMMVMWKGFLPVSLSLLMFYSMMIALIMALPPHL